MATFWHGCNYPWSTDGSTIYYGLDFGANVWGSHLGVSTRRERVAADFAEMAALGFRVARWFVFCDGRAGIVYDEAGMPSGVDAHLFADLDAALEIGRAHGIALSLVLLDHRFAFRGLTGVMPDAVSGALLEVSLPVGRAAVLREPDGQGALFDRGFDPLVHRYSPNGARGDLADWVFAYELMNEPDFVIEEWERDLSRHVPMPIPFADLADLVARLSDLVHGCSAALTTMAAARLRNLWAWDDAGLGLDFLQVHSYPNLANPGSDEDVFGRPAASLGCTRPVVLGEFPGNGPVCHPAWCIPPGWTLDDYLGFALRGGYLGAWPWSFSGTDAYGPLPAKPLQRFAMSQPSLVNPRSRGGGGQLVNLSERS